MRQLQGVRHLFVELKHTACPQINDCEQAARFWVEVAKSFTRGQCRFYDPDEYAVLLARYGSLAHLRGMGSFTGDGAP